MRKTPKAMTEDCMQMPMESTQQQDTVLHMDTMKMNQAMDQTVILKDNVMAQVRARNIHVRAMCGRRYWA